MSKKRQKASLLQTEEVVQANEQVQDQNEYVQNEAPAVQWATFEQCWSACVKNGKQIHFEACKAHVKALGVLNKPEAWIDAIRHFGIEIEK